MAEATPDAPNAGIRLVVGVLACRQVGDRDRLPRLLRFRGSLLLRVAEAPTRRVAGAQAEASLAAGIHARRLRRRQAAEDRRRSQVARTLARQAEREGRAAVLLGLAAQEGADVDIQRVRRLCRALPHSASLLRSPPARRGPADSAITVHTWAVRERDRFCLTVRAAPGVTPSGICSGQAADSLIPPLSEGPGRAPPSGGDGRAAVVACRGFGGLPDRLPEQERRQAWSSAAIIASRRPRRSSGGS